MVSTIDNSRHMLYRLPLLTPYLIWRSLSKEYPPDFDSNEYIYGYARCALEDAYRIVGLKPADIILYPDYICDVTLWPSTNIGLKIEYYPVDDKMEPDWNKIEELIKKGAKAVLSVNYFGFPQQMHRWKEITSKYGVWWIEDNAHGYGGSYEDIPLGNWGHVSVTSIRKTLPLLSGALLRVNDKRLLQYPFLNKSTTLKTRKKLCREELLRGAGYLLRWAEIPYNKYRAVPYTLSSSLDSELSRPGGIDALSLHILPFLKKNVYQVSVARRAAYTAWHSFAKGHGLKPLFDDLPIGVSPFVFPCFADSFESRQLWLKWGRENNIEVYPWPNLPEAVLQNNEEAVNRLNHMLCFPVHQDMNPESILKLRQH